MDHVPDESDIIISSFGILGSCSIASCEGKIIAKATGDEDIYAMVKKWMEDNSWFPNVFILSDHGNYILTEVK